MLDKINKLTNWQAALIIIVLGFAVFFSGLNNAFAGDDTAQIVDNVPVHSISNIPLFFEGGTFYVGKGTAPLYGVYYRPLMTTVFSVLYSLFGAHPFYFHAFQLLLCIASAFLLYLFFRYSFRPALALFLALIFLVHPIRSQVVYAIPAMQDALFFFFGILAIWLLVRFKSVKNLFLVAACLLLCLLSKESGVLFVAMALLYLFWWDRKRLYLFLGIIVLPVTLWIGLKTQAVGFLGTNPHNAPIDALSLGERLLTAPSILLFYIIKFLFPLHLASQYHWIQPVFDFRHVALPLLIDIAVIASIIYGGYILRKKASKATFYTYLFFATWSCLGLLLTLQIIPVDMTACENWFYFPMVGILGMLGVLATTFAPSVRFDRRILLVLMVLAIAVLGVRTAVRGSDWHDIYTISYSDIKVSKEDFNAYNVIAANLYAHGSFNDAETYAKKSVRMFPQGTNNNTLGLIEYKLGNYTQARQAYLQALKFQDSPDIYENVALAMLYSGDYNENIHTLNTGLTKYPQNATIWLWLAVLEYQNGDTNDAKQAISQARYYGQTNIIDQAYALIMNNQKITVGQRLDVR